MTNLRTAAQQALEALDKLYLPGELERVNAAITVLRAALAQEQEQEQEPVAWRYQDARGNYRYRGYVQGFDKEYSRLKPVPLYTAPPQALAHEQSRAWYTIDEINAKFDPPKRQPPTDEEQEMPSNTRYTVAVEGRAPTYWDCIHDAMTNAQGAVYAGADNITHAINDLKSGRIAEWSYGFSAVRIYPPQNNTVPPKRQPLTREEIMDLCASQWAAHPVEVARLIEWAHGIGGDE